MKRKCFFMLCVGLLLSSQLSWAAQWENLLYPSYKRLRALEGFYNQITTGERVRWEPETYAQSLILGLKSENNQEPIKDLIRQVVREYAEHVEEDYVSGYIEVINKLKSLKNIKFAVQRIFHYGPVITPALVQRFEEVFRAAVYRRPHLKLFLVREGNQAGRCEGTVIFDSYHDEVLWMGSCEVL